VWHAGCLADIEVATIFAYVVKRRGKTIGRKIAKKGKKGKATQSMNTIESNEEEGESKEANMTSSKNTKRLMDVMT
jgi:hypothetical protein